MSMAPMILKKRMILIQWFRKWIYKLVSEQAAIEGQAALWVPVVSCSLCRWAIMSGSRFCPYCGALQERETDGPETETQFTILIDGRPTPMRLDGQTPRQAYQRRRKEVVR
jgi:hypothetical protein